MIQDFRDFCLWAYVVIDDTWQLAPLFSWPGPAPLCSDSEFITMVLVGECRGWDEETEAVSQWQELRDLFPGSGLHQTDQPRDIRWRTCRNRMPPFAHVGDTFCLALRSSDERTLDASAAVTPVTRRPLPYQYRPRK
jgi:hypothetical protein